MLGSFVPPKVTLVDYGIGNLLSVRRGFEFWGFEVETSDSPMDVLSAERVVLPGVGSFRNGISELQKRGLDDAIREVASKGVPLLAICLGMQLLFDFGEENGTTPGLGIIPGAVKVIPKLMDSGLILRVPHIGWNAIIAPTPNSTFESIVLQTIETKSEVYFNHSFMVHPNEPSDLKAVCNYGGHLVAAVVERKNVIGCQFHPEKSGAIGLMILKNFCDQ